jgi:hypothetical protein
MYFYEVDVGENLRTEEPLAKGIDNLEALQSVVDSKVMMQRGPQLQTEDSRRLWSGQSISTVQDECSKREESSSAFSGWYNIQPVPRTPSAKPTPTPPNTHVIAPNLELPFVAPTNHHFPPSMSNDAMRPSPPIILL